MDSNVRRRCFEDIDVNTNNTTTSALPIKKSKRIHSPLKIYTFGWKESPPHIQVQTLSNSSLYDLVEIAFQVFNPRNGETADSHCWNMWLNDKLKFRSTKARDVKLGQLASELEQRNVTMTLEYDYGRTTFHEFTVVAIEDLANRRAKDFPRPKPTGPIPRDRTVYHPTPFSSPPPPITTNLNEAFPSLNEWCFRPGEIKELNFFQGGRKFVYGYLETFDQQMILMPDKANSLNHFFQCLERASTTPRTGSYGWHSIVVIPGEPDRVLNQRLKPFAQELEPGFCDCHLVEEEAMEDDLCAMFPKVSAFAGFTKDKVMKRKGWIRYKDRVLLICTGSGSPVAHPNSPKGTAFHGEGPHVPANPEEDVLFGIRKEFQSLHEMFCEAERLLGTL